MSDVTQDINLDISELADALKQGVEVQDRKYRLKTYKECFVGKEAVDWLVESGAAADREQAVMIGNVLLEQGVFHHVVRDHDFKDEELFYRFSDDEDHGRLKTDEEGRAISWSDFLPGTSGKSRGSGAPSGDPSSESRLPRIPTYEDELAEMGKAAEIGVSPMDEHNVELLDNVHPAAWEDPEPEASYNMVVIGAGTGGLVTAAAVAGLGGKVALIESHLMGGDCLNVGCVPSKALISAARAAHAVKTAGHYGISVEGVPDDELADRVTVDFPAIMERLRARRAQISHHDSAERFSRELGVDVYIGRGTFTGPDTVEVNGKTLKFARACIATGGTPTLPPIPGIDSVQALTNLNLFNLTQLPERLAIIGAGVIGVEMAQTFSRLGSEVTVIERGSRMLPREEEDAAAVVQHSMEEDGVDFRFNTEVVRVAPQSLSESTPGTTGNQDKTEQKRADQKKADQGSGSKGDQDPGFSPVRLTLSTGGTVDFDAMLVATGRKPNVTGLGLEEAGVDFDERKGVLVDDRLQTSNRNIYAVGDVATRYQFTHAADFMARIVVKNALFFGRDKFSNLIIPWAVYTDPELAHVGLYPQDLEERGIEYETYTREFANVDRAIVSDKTAGFVRVHLRKGSDEILGATIVGPHAGDMISEITLAMYTDTGLGTLANVIHPYPTMAEAIRQAGDQYNRTRLTTTVKKILRGVLAVRR